MPEVSSDTFLFLYSQGLQSLAAFAGKNQNWQICGKNLLPSTALAYIEQANQTAVQCKGAVIVIFALSSTTCL